MQRCNLLVVLDILLASGLVLIWLDGLLCMYVYVHLLYLHLEVVGHRGELSSSSS